MASNARECHKKAEGEWFRTESKKEGHTGWTELKGGVRFQHEQMCGL